ncbi:hypothetical protein [Chryseobacterium contaminans]|uniref:hypothetical protein n=1 Tax=Chryseobacterium contaminans TaxID=1423959 RepID=UPI003AFACFD5
MLIIVSSWSYNRRKDREYRKKYDELINELKQKNTKADESSKGKDQINSSISSETEKKLLKKLETFENSEKFLKKGINIAYLSNFLNTNPKYLSEVIKNYKSQNFNTYINSLRINYIVDHLYNDPKYREYKISYLAENAVMLHHRFLLLHLRRKKELHLHTLLIS